MALVSDIQLQSSAVKPPNLDTSQKFSAEGLTATTAFSVTDAGAGTTVTPLGLMTAQSANDISAYFNTTNTDGDVNLYLNNDANPYWNLKLSGTASDSFMITNACGGPAGGTAAEKTALSITPVGAVGIGKASASNILDISYADSSSGGMVLTQSTNSVATKIISLATCSVMGTSTNHKLGFITNNTTVGMFDTSGNFGIGTEAPGATLDVRGSAIFNEAGAAVDFRIEGDTCANLFFVDGSADKIGIGTATPQVLLDIDNGGATTQLLMCVNGKVCAQGFCGEKEGHIIESSEAVCTQRRALNFVLTDVGCVVDDGIKDATVVCVNGANTCVPFLLADGSTSDPISLAGGSIGNQLSNDSNPTLGGLMCGNGNNICAVCCICITGCYFGDGSQLSGGVVIPSKMSGDCTIIGCSAGGNIAAGAVKVTLYGANAGYNATTPSNVVVIGESAALCMTTATDTVLIGSGSGRCVMTCAGNVALGAWSLYNECAGTNNTVVGTCAGHAQKGATTNTFVGSQAGAAASTGSGNVFIGYRAGCACTTQSNRLYIGNATPILVGDITCGLVGIGTTSVVTHAADTSVLQIGGNAVLWGNKAVGASKSLQISQNAHYDEDGSWEYISTDEASNYYQDSGTHAFRYAASGTAGADITWSTALAITNAGLVGIGETSPGALLHLKKDNGSAAIRMEREDTSVASGNEIGGIIMTGGESSADVSVARIVTYADDTWTSTSSPTRIEFETTPTGATADALAMTIDSTGNVGIGTVAPSAPLHITSADGGGILNIGDCTVAGYGNISQYINLGSPTTTGDGWQVGKKSSGAGSFAPAKGFYLFNMLCNEASFVIDVDSNVGIGTSTPDRPLTVEGSIGVKTTSATGNPQMAFRQATTDKAYLTYWDASDTLGLTNASAAGLHFDPTNVRVGIGTAAPASLLHLYTTTAAPTALTISNSNADANAAYLKFQKISASPADNDMAGLIDFYAENDNNEDVRSALIYSQMIDVSDGTEDGNLVFKTMVAGSLNTTMTIQEGIVGIGTAAPNALLHLAKDNGSAAIRMERVDTSVASGNEIGGLIMTGGESSADVPVARIVTYADDTWTSTSSPTRIEFEVTPSGATADVLAMTLDSTGNLGIGTAAPGSAIWNNVIEIEGSVSGTSS